MENQVTIRTWGRATFGPSTAQAITTRMNVEVAEMINALQNAADAKTPEERTRILAHAAGEGADVYIMLAQAMEELGVDLQAEVDAKVAILRNRRWRNTPSGRNQHVTEFKEPGSGLWMDLRCWYILSDSGSFYTSQGFDTENNALNWLHSPEGRQAHLLEREEISLPIWDPEKNAWDELNVANILFARDLYDHWLATDPTHLEGNWK